MSEATTANPFRATSAKDALTEVVRIGAQRMLTAALEAEVETYIEGLKHVLDEHGRRVVVRNGHLPEREITTGIGPLEVRQPRVNDRRVDEDGERQRFTSSILPPYLRRTKSIDELIPWLFLKGVSSGGFSDALTSILGPDAPGLSATSVVRLKQVWEKDFEGWSKRSLANKRYVYMWVDGVHFNVRLEGERACILVVIGATADGDKELLAVHDGVREGEQSWSEVLLDLKARGLEVSPEVAVGDGALGFWKALPKVFPTTRTQRCWVHKTANILNHFPRGMQPEVKQRLHDIWMAATKERAERAFDHFVQVYQAKYPKAVACLTKDRDALLCFYDFPAEHWQHLRTTNPIESTFATVRLRTARTKGCGSRIATLTMVFKLAHAAQHSWRKLNGHQLLTDVIRGVRFIDGIKELAA
jgi:transposase-like protein